MVNSDHDMRETMVRITSPWEAELESERRVILTSWNLSQPAWGEWRSLQM